MSRKQLPTVSYEPVSYDDRRFLALIYGDIGSGKTTIAASAQYHPDLANVFFINVEDGIVSADHVVGALKGDAPTPLHVQSIVNDLLKPQAQRPEALRTVNTVVIDSVSRLKDKTLDMLAGRSVDRGKREETYLIELQDFNHSNVLISQMVDSIMQTDMNVILLAGVDEKIVNGVTTEIKPLLNAKLAKSLGHMMHFVWYAKEQGGRYGLLTLPVGVHKIKTRNPYFVRKLREVTKEGWYSIPDFDYPTIPTLYDLYLSSKPE